MQIQAHKNIFIYKFLNGLSAVGFSKYTICCVTLRAKEPKNHFGTWGGEELQEKLEGRITVKAWKELPAKFPVCILGDHSLLPDEFSGIIMIDNSQALENPGKYIPKIIAEFKNRSTRLLNQFHGTHGRVFWENSYNEIRIDSVESFNRTMLLLKRGAA